MSFTGAQPVPSAMTLSFWGYREWPMIALNFSIYSIHSDFLDVC